MTQPDGNPEIGIGRTLMYALAIWPTDVVSRATLRALLPMGEARWKGSLSHARWIRGEMNSGKTTNNVSARFKNRLERFESEGLILRGDNFVRIIDRRELFNRAVRDVRDPDHRKFIKAQDAALILEKSIELEESDRVRQLRSAELDFIRSLMIPADSRDSRRRQVRHESGVIEIPLGETASRHFGKKHTMKRVAR